MSSESLVFCILRYLLRVHADRLSSIVVVHDLYGHPWYSFAQSNGHGASEEIWLINQLPRLLEENSEHRVYARIMTFGYKQDMWIAQPLEKIKKNAEEVLLKCLEAQRSSVRKRSLFSDGPANWF